MMYFIPQKSLCSSSAETTFFYQPVLDFMPKNHQMSALFFSFSAESGQSDSSSQQGDTDIKPPPNGRYTHIHVRTCVHKHTHMHAHLLSECCKISIVELIQSNLIMDAIRKHSHRCSTKKVTDGVFYRGLILQTFAFSY